MSLSVQRVDGVVRIEVTDDGSGFDPTATATANGFGLAGMRERLHQLSGHLEINSSPHGTTVRVTVPLWLAAGDSPETLPHAAAKSTPAAII